jgi:archaellum biogenesis protein FlaJ (TadC family)
MNATHLHLLLNHVPVLGVVFGVLLLGAALVRKSQELLKASLVVFAICAAMAVPVYLSGEPAEHLVEHLPGISEPVIEAHEEAAEVAFIAVIVLGVAAVAMLIVFRAPRSIPRPVSAGALIIALATCGLLLRTANLGGKVRHTEIRDNQPAATASIGSGRSEDTK